MIIALLTAFVLYHFDASTGWWVAYGATIAFCIAAVIFKNSND
jgi:hypothetical protein